MYKQFFLATFVVAVSALAFLPSADHEREIFSVVMGEQH